jgi:hypothetical protein
MNKATRAERIGRAVLDGWGIDGFRRAARKTMRHCVWIREPRKCLWQAVKVDGSVRDWINALLDEAGIPV